MAEWIRGPLKFRSNMLENVGDEVTFHSHDYSHVTFVKTGAARVEKSLLRVDAAGNIMRDDEEQPIIVMVLAKIFRSPLGHLNIEANSYHKCIAIEPHTEIWCVFPHRNYKGEIVEDYAGWDKAYN